MLVILLILVDFLFQLIYIGNSDNNLLGFNDIFNNRVSSYGGGLLSYYPVKFLIYLLSYYGSLLIIISAIITIIFLYFNINHRELVLRIKHHIVNAFDKNEYIEDTLDDYQEEDDIIYDEYNSSNVNRENSNEQRYNKIKDKDLFVAIRGGNNFVNEALNKGAFVVYDNSDIEIDGGFEKKAFFVHDSVKFLQKFAKKWCDSLNIKVIGITGSNGKTTVKDMIYHILSQKYKGKKTLGNYNNHIGLPFTLLRSETDDKFIILEMGMSDFGEIDLLGQIANPDINVITNIGESHLEFLKTKENVFRAKTEILPYIKEALIVNGDDKYLKNIKSEKIIIASSEL